MLNRRVDLHAIDATLARWCGTISTQAETREFLSKEFSISLDFAARFEAYVEAAAAFADGAEDGAQSLAGIDRVQSVVGELRRQMPV